MVFNGFEVKVAPCFYANSIIGFSIYLALFNIGLEHVFEYLTDEGQKGSVMTNEGQSWPVRVSDGQ